MSEVELFELAMADWEQIDLLDQRVNAATREMIRMAWHARWSAALDRAPGGMSRGMNRLLTAIARTPSPRASRERSGRGERGERAFTMRIAA